jgi:hypothetical protein
MMQLKRATLLQGCPDLKWNPKMEDDDLPIFYESRSSLAKARLQRAEG